ncbi:MAG: Rpn family recombination-promoting nuclease/putative transposase [Verrucomicrobiales bacterium]
MQKGNGNTPGDEWEGGKLHHGKDKFARKMLSYRELAVSFFQTFLPELNPGGDWSGLQQESGSFVSEQYASKYSDILYSLRLGDKEAFVYLLIEHKSQQDHWTLLYLLQLMVQIWAKWRDEHGGARRHLPPIIPIILHQSADQWTAPINFHEYFTKVDACAKHLPQFQSELVDLAKVPVENIEDWLLQTVIGLMKAVREGTSTDWLLRNAGHLSRILQSRYGPGLLGFMLTYLAEESEGEINASTIRQIAGKIADSKLKHEVMTWAESLRSEAKEEGIIEGELRGQLNTYRELLGLPALPDAQFDGMSLEAMKDSLCALKAEAKKRFS